jgi:nitroreductase
MLEEIVKRRSVRNYKKDPVSDEDILKVINAAQFAPSARDSKPWEFYIVKNDDIKLKLFELVGQDFVKDAPVLIAVCVDPEKSYHPVKDISVASMSIFLEAIHLNLGTVWKNLRDDQTDEVKKIIGIPENYIIINLIPLGYPAETLPPHQESDFNKDKIHWVK